MKKSNYVMPQIEILDIEIEDVVLSSSDVSASNLESFIEGSSLGEWAN